MLPWYFAHDHVHYARYLPVYLIHMILLPDTHPEAPPLKCRELITKHGFAQLPFDQTIKHTEQEHEDKRGYHWF